MKLKPVIYALSAVFIYAAQNVILEQKLARFTTAGLLTCFYLVMLPLSVARLGTLRFTGEAIIFPSGIFLATTLLVGFMYFFADYFYVGAYNVGGDAFTLTTIFILLPPVTSAMKYLWVREAPAASQIVGYLLITLGVILVVKGNNAG